MRHRTNFHFASFVIGKVAVQLSQSNMSCAYCLKASHSVRLNGKG